MQSMLFALLLLLGCLLTVALGSLFLEALRKQFGIWAFLAASAFMLIAAWRLLVLILASFLIVLDNIWGATGVYRAIGVKAGFFRSKIREFDTKIQGDK